MTVSLRKPSTHANDKPTDLVGRYVAVRPYYHVPSSPSSLTPARSPWAYEAQVERESADMVLVRFTWETDSAPWAREGLYFPRELHRSRGCECPACSYLTDGIPHHHGA